MSGNKISIIVLNWNGWRDTIECLESLSQIEYSNIQIIVVDNGSKDGSIDKIKEWADGKLAVQSKYFNHIQSSKPIHYIEYNIRVAELGSIIEKEKDTHKTLSKGSPHLLIIIRLDENIGFARGNNVGIRFALSSLDCEYIMVLNNDTTVRPDFLMPLLEVFDKYPRVGLSGSKIMDYYTGKHWQGALTDRINIFITIMFFTPLKIFFNISPLARRYLLRDSGYKRVYGIAGCCMLFKSKILEEIGLFDETTFLGWEEYIIAEKLLKYGYETYAVPKSIIYHKMARDTLRIEPVEKTMIFLKSEKYFQESYLKMPSYQRSIIKAIRLLAYSIIAIFNSAFRKKYKQLVCAIIEKE